MASHIGGRYWLTAAHCLPTRWELLKGWVGFIRSADGDYGGIEGIERHPETDLGLIRVGTGLSHKPSFDIAKEMPTKGHLYKTLGYCGRSYSSLTTIKALHCYGDYGTTTNHYIFGYLMKPHHDYGIGAGDSGGLVYQGDTLYGAISASPDPDEMNPNDTRHIFVSTASRVPYWIKTSKSSLYEESNWVSNLWAYRGGLAAESDRYILSPEDSCVDDGSSSSSSSF